MSGVCISLSLGAPVTGVPGQGVPAPDFLLTGGIAGDISSNAGNGAVTVTISAPAAFAGSYTQDVDGNTLSSTALGAGPQCLVATEITGDGTPAEGETLSAAAGLWVYATSVGAPIITRAWQADAGGNGTFADISGASDLTYLLTSNEAGDNLRMIETANQGGGQFRTVPSNVLSVAAGTVAPLNTSLPAINGTAVVGQTLAFNEGIWTGVPAPTLSLQLERSDDGATAWSDVAGATGLSYALQAADEGAHLRLRVTGSNADPSSPSTAYSPVVGPVQAAQSFALVQNAQGEIEISAISGDLTVTVTAPSEYAGTYTTDTDGTPLNPASLATGPQCLVAPVIAGDGSPSVGETLTSIPGLWIYDDANGSPSVAAQWQSDTNGNGNFVAIGGATANSLTLSGAEDGDTVRMIETATDLAGVRGAVSNALAVGATGPAFAVFRQTPQDRTGVSSSDFVATFTGLPEDPTRKLLFLIAAGNDANVAVADPVVTADTNAIVTKVTNNRGTVAAVLSDVGGPDATITLSKGASGAIRGVAITCYAIIGGQVLTALTGEADGNPTTIDLSQNVFASDVIAVVGQSFPVGPTTTGATGYYDTVLGSWINATLADHTATSDETPRIVEFTGRDVSGISIIMRTL